MSLKTRFHNRLVKLHRNLTGPSGIKQELAVMVLIILVIGSLVGAVWLLALAFVASMMVTSIIVGVVAFVAAAAVATS